MARVALGAESGFRYFDSDKQDLGCFMLRVGGAVSSDESNEESGKLPARSKKKPRERLFSEVDLTTGRQYGRLNAMGRLGSRFSVTGSNFNARDGLRRAVQFDEQVL